jgi:hypothetical protein
MRHIVDCGCEHDVHLNLIVVWHRRLRMIDPRSRTEAALLLRRFASGRITNDDFDERYPRRSPDPGVVAVGGVAWTLYSDLRTYRLVGQKALSSTDRRLVARCMVFLHSGLP